MKLEEVQDILQARPSWQAGIHGYRDQEIHSCHASDLLSDVLAFRGEGSLLLTGLTNPQVIRTAEILDFAVVCFVRGKQPQPETVALAEEKGILLLVTPLLMFDACGRLYEKGLRGVSQKRGVAG